MSLAVFERITAVTFRYVDWISQEVVVEYERERERWLEHRNSVRAVRVREVLDTTDVDLDAITSAISYLMRRIHLGLFLWLPEETTQGDELVRLERFLRELTESLQTQGSSLFVAADRVSGWGWIPLHPAAVPTVVADIRRFVAKHDDSPSIALGSPLPGVEGFRRSHGQAQRARKVAIAAGAGAASVTAADDPGLSAAALLGDSLDEARIWVREVLGPLSSNTENDARLRETLPFFLRPAPATRPRPTNSACISIPSNTARSGGGTAWPADRRRPARRGSRAAGLPLVRRRRPGLNIGKIASVRPTVRPVM